MRIVVTDTSPIRYLVLTGKDNLLEKLYGHILVPESVYRELQAERTPASVRAWMRTPPPWIEIVSTPISSPERNIPPSLGPGESDALRIAIEMKADLILMDDRAGVEAARKLGLTVTGTLGILARCAERGWIDLRSALKQLQQTNFRVHPRLIEEMLSGPDREPR